MTRASLRSDPRLRGRGRHRSPWNPRRLRPYAWYDAELGQPKYVGYVQLNGGSTDNISTPDSALNSFSNDIEVIMRVRPDDWTTGAIQTLCGKYLTTGNQRSWRFYISATGAIGLTASANGTAVTTVTVTPTTPFVDATWIWLRLRLDLTDGANSVGTIDIAPDTGNNYTIPTSWTANGTNTSTTLSGVYDGTGVVEIGAFNSGTSERLAGRVGRCIVKAGFDGTTTSDFNANDCYGSGYAHADGYYWTLGIPKIYDRSGNNVAPAVFGSGTNQPVWLPWKGYAGIYSPSAIGNYVRGSVAGAALSAIYTQEFTIKVTLDAIGVINGLCTTNSTFTNMQLDASNRLIIAAIRPDLVSRIGQVTSSAVPGLAPGIPVWLRGRVNIVTAQCDYWYSYDSTENINNVNWTLLTSAIGNNPSDPVTDVYLPSSHLCHFGTTSSGSAGANCSIHAGEYVVNDGSTTYTAGFRASEATQDNITFYSGNFVAISRISTGRKTVVQSPAARSARSLILLGTDDYIVVPASAVPTFGIADAGSVLIAERQHATQVNYRRIFSTESASNQGLQIAARDGSSVSIAGFFGDSVGPTLVGGDIANIAMGTRTVVSMSVSGRSATGITLRANAANPVAVNNAAVGDVPINSPSRLGTPAFSSIAFAEFEFEALVLRDATTSNAEHAQLVAYYGGGL